MAQPGSWCRPGADQPDRVDSAEAGSQRLWEAPRCFCVLLQAVLCSKAGVARLPRCCPKAAEQWHPTPELGWLEGQDVEDRMVGGCRRNPRQRMRTEIVLAY